jgi:uncharacterized damage-inducible protein DinB
MADGMSEQMKLSTIFYHWKQVRDDLLSTIDKFDNQELSFVPFESSWPAGQIMLHIGDAEEGWFRRVVSQEIDEWSDYNLDDYPTTESIKTKLTEIHDRTEVLLDSLELDDLDRVIQSPWSEYRFSLGWIIWHVLEHEIHHRAELSLILGMLGREGLDV